MEKQIEEILSGGYKSPIEIIVGQAKLEFEDGVYKAVQGYGVNVDKEELIRALQYDRGQYEKGYADGLRHRETEWISVEERLPEAGVDVLVSIKIRDRVVVDTDHIYCGNWFSYGILHPSPRAYVTHWMPFPEPPKGE